MRTAPYRAAGLLLLVEALLLFVPAAILGQAIRWPEILGEPAATVLPLIYAQSDATRLGYLIYLAYSIIFWPVALLVVQALRAEGGDETLLRLAAGFGVASAVARTLGIIRWLGPMPALATLYVDPSTDAQTRATIEIVYHTLNDYAGTVGEILGVSLFAALWAALVAVVLARTNTLPRWLAPTGLVAALVLATPLIELFGVDIGPLLAIPVLVLHTWFLAMGIVLLRHRAKTAPVAGAVAGH